MDAIFNFIKRNYIALGIAALMYFIYMQFTFAGNRICDCQSTEKYTPGTSSGYRGGVMRYYHK